MGESLYDSKDVIIEDIVESTITENDLDGKFPIMVLFLGANIWAILVTAIL